MRRQAQKESQHNATEIERWQHNLELAFLSTSRLTTHMSNFVHMTHLGKQITGDKTFLQKTHGRSKITQYEKLMLGYWQLAPLNLCGCHLSCKEEPNPSSNFNASFPFLS
jgi:hypothetical protein